MLDIYDLIIIILIILIIVAIFNNYDILKYFSLKREGFTVNELSNESDNIFGNILNVKTFSEDESKYTKIFTQEYKLTGFTVKLSRGNNYKFRVNNTFIDNNNNIELTSDKYYDLTNLNIKTKKVEVTTVNEGDSLENIIIYGLSVDNTYTKTDYYDKNIIDLDGNIQYMIYYIKVPSCNSLDNTGEYVVKNKYVSDGNFMNINSGIKEYDGKYNCNSDKIFFNKPVLATNIDLMSDNANIDLSDVKIYGKVASQNDKNKYELSKLNSKVTLDGMKCPPMKEMVTKQKIINDICNSIAEKDTNMNLKEQYERTKKYLAKLNNQEKQINQLKNKLNEIKKYGESSTLNFAEKSEQADAIVNEFNVQNEPYKKIKLTFE